MNRRQKLRRFFKNLSFTDYVVIGVVVILSPIILFCLVLVTVVEIAIIILYAQKIFNLFLDGGSTWFSIDDVVTLHHVPRYAAKLLIFGFAEQGHLMYRVREPFPEDIKLNARTISLLERNKLSPDTAQFFEFKFNQRGGKKMPRLYKLVPEFGSILTA